MCVCSFTETTEATENRSTTSIVEPFRVKRFDQLDVMMYTLEFVE